MGTERSAFAILGATGFTGQAIVSYLRKRIKTPLKWIIAGRNRQSLTEVAGGFAPALAPKVVVIEDLEHADLRHLTDNAEWLVNAAGPYARHGARVIESCLESGTHYIDMTGEVDVIADWIHRFHDRARALKIQIVPAAGFEALPFDLMTQAVVEKVAKDYPRRQIHVDTLLSYRGLNWASFPQFASRGTLATALETLIRNPAKESLVNPLSLSGVEAAHAPRGTKPLKLSAEYDNNYKVWRAPLLPGPFVNPAIIHRSNALMEQLGKGYGPGFSYRESMNVSSIAPWPWGQSVLAHTLASGAVEYLAALGKDTARRQSALALWRGFVSRPSRLGGAAIDGIDYQLDVVASQEGVPRAMARLKGTGHPGYRSTGNILGELVLDLGQSGERVRRGGVLTPAVALGSAALNRLESAGIACEWL
ncbi:saccharopine dehydrogenase NADP-binding domain-containing protein [Luminiphilus sp.]|nr:saccharopine dehydrogenase NADP-binding domain-containing protein [Luminiphilus sp.]MDB3922997.1 saccharopine dehydrogenase NADP-binding domain-containing protein [Luminiphilus sp.]